MVVIQTMYDLRCINLSFLNRANIVLTPPKKEGADKITNYMPMSLIHAVAKDLAPTSQSHNQHYRLNKQKFFHKRPKHSW